MMAVLVRARNRRLAARIGQRLFSDRTWRSVAAATGLAPRELEIVRRVFDDQKEAAIARELGISPHTVHTYLERIYRKLKVASRVQLVVRIVALQRSHARRCPLTS
jgi:DNA-binding CsgD family transcriptional regulator